MKEWEIKQIKRAIHSCENKRKSHYENTPHKASNAIKNEDTKIKALKKQIPKKVIPYCKSGTAMACPECGTFQDFTDKETLNNRSEWCYKCGQALDWSDTE